MFNNCNKYELSDIGYFYNLYLYLINQRRQLILINSNYETFFNNYNKYRVYIIA